VSSCAPALTILLLTVTLAYYTVVLWAMKSPKGSQYIVHCHLTKGQLGVPMAIDRPAGRLILVKQLFDYHDRSGVTMATLLVHSP